MRCTEQVKGGNANCVQKLQEPISNGGQAAVELSGTIGEARAKLIERIYRGMLRKRRNRKAPREGIPHQAVQQDEWWTGTGLQVAHATAVNRHETLVSGERWRRGKILLDVRFHAGFFAPSDNSFPLPGVYVTDIASVASE